MSMVGAFVPCQPVFYSGICATGLFFNRTFSGNITCLHKKAGKWRVDCGPCTVSTGFNQHILARSLDGPRKGYNCDSFPFEQDWTLCEGLAREAATLPSTLRLGLSPKDYAYNITALDKHGRPIEFRYSNSSGCYSGYMDGSCVIFPVHSINTKCVKDVDISALCTMAPLSKNLTCVYVGERKFTIDQNVTVKHLNGKTRMKCFRFDGNLVSGTPITNEQGKLVSIITCSAMAKGGTYYAVERTTSSGLKTNLRADRYHSSNGNGRGRGRGRGRATPSVLSSVFSGSFLSSTSIRGRGTRKVFADTPGAPLAAQQKIDRSRFLSRELQAATKELDEINARLRRDNQIKADLQRTIGRLADQIKNIQVGGQRREHSKFPNLWTLALMLLVFLAGLSSMAEAKNIASTTTPKVTSGQSEPPKDCRLDNCAVEPVYDFSRNYAILENARKAARGGRAKRDASEAKFSAIIGRVDSEKACNAYLGNYSVEACASESTCTRDTSHKFLMKSGADCAWGYSGMSIDSSGNKYVFSGVRDKRCSLACFSTDQLIELALSQPNWNRCLCPIVSTICRTIPTWHYRKQAISHEWPGLQLYGNAIIIAAPSSYEKYLCKYRATNPCDWGVADTGEACSFVGAWCCSPPPTLPSLDGFTLDLKHVKPLFWVNVIFAIAVLVVFDRYGFPMLGLLACALLIYAQPILADACTIQGFVDVLANVDSDGGTHNIYSGHTLVAPGTCIMLGSATAMSIEEIVIGRNYDLIGIIPYYRKTQCTMMDWNCHGAGHDVCKDPRVSCKDSCNNVSGLFYFDKCDDQQAWTGSECLESAAQTHVDACIETGTSADEYFAIYSYLSTAQETILYASIIRAGVKTKVVIKSSELGMHADVNIQSIKIDPVVPTVYSQIGITRTSMRCSMLPIFPDSYCPGFFDGYDGGPLDSKLEVRWEPLKMECLRPTFRWNSDSYIISSYEKDGLDYFGRSMTQCPSDVYLRTNVSFGKSHTFFYKLNNARMELRAKVPIKGTAGDLCKSVDDISVAITPGVTAYFKHTQITVSTASTNGCIVDIDARPCSVVGSSEIMPVSGKPWQVYVLCGWHVPSTIRLVGDGAVKIVDVKGKMATDIDYLIKHSYHKVISVAANATNVFQSIFGSLGIAVPAWLADVGDILSPNRFFTVLVVGVLVWFALNALVNGAMTIFLVLMVTISLLVSTWFAVADDSLGGHGRGDEGLDNLAALLVVAIFCLKLGPIFIIRDILFFIFRLVDYMGYWAVIPNQLCWDEMVQMAYLVAILRYTDGLTSILFVALLLSERDSNVVVLKKIISENYNSFRLEILNLSVLSYALSRLFCDKNSYQTSVGYHSRGGGRYNKLRTIFTARGKINAVELRWLVRSYWEENRGLTGFHQLYLDGFYITFLPELGGVLIPSHFVGRCKTVVPIAYDLCWLSIASRDITQDFKVAMRTCDNITLLNRSVHREVIDLRTFEKRVVDIWVDRDGRVGWMADGRSKSSLVGLSGAYWFQNGVLHIQRLAIQDDPCRPVCLPTRMDDIRRGMDQSRTIRMIAGPLVETSAIGGGSEDEGIRTQVFEREQQGEDSTEEVGDDTLSELPGWGELVSRYRIDDLVRDDPASIAINEHSYSMFRDSYENCQQIDLDGMGGAFRLYIASLSRYGLHFGVSHDVYGSDTDISIRAWLDHIYQEYEVWCRKSGERFDEVTFDRLLTDVVFSRGAPSLSRSVEPLAEALKRSRKKFDKLENISWLSDKVRNLSVTSYEILQINSEIERAINENKNGEKATVRFLNRTVAVDKKMIRVGTYYDENTLSVSNSDAGMACAELYFANQLGIVPKINNMDLVDVIRGQPNVLAPVNKSVITIEISTTDEVVDQLNSILSVAYGHLVWHKSLDYWESMIVSDPVQFRNVSFDFCRPSDPDKCVVPSVCASGMSMSCRMSSVVSIGSGMLQSVDDDIRLYSNCHVTNGNDVHLTNVSDKEIGEYIKFSRKVENKATDVVMYTDSATSIELKTPVEGAYYLLASAVDGKKMFFECMKSRGFTDDLATPAALFRPVDVDFKNRVVKPAVWCAKPGLSGTAIIDWENSVVGIYGLSKFIECDNRSSWITYTLAPDDMTENVRYFQDAAHQVFTQTLPPEALYWFLEAPTGTGKTKTFTTECLKLLGDGEKLLLLQPTVASARNTFSNIKENIEMLGLDKYRVALNCGGNISDVAGEGTIVCDVQTYGYFLAHNSGAMRRGISEYKVVLLDEVHMRSDTTIGQMHLQVLRRGLFGKNTVVGSVPVLITATDIDFGDKGKRLNGNIELSGERFFVKDEVLQPITTTNQPGYLYLDLRNLARTHNIWGSVYRIPLTEAMSGRCLIFVHSVRAATALRDAIKVQVGGHHVVAFHAGCGINIRDLPNDCIIVATDALGVSVTIAGCSTVVDLCLEVKPTNRLIVRDSNIHGETTKNVIHYESKMETRIIDHQTQKQRRGRTGRTCRGSFYYLQKGLVNRNMWPDTLVNWVCYDMVEQNIEGTNVALKEVIDLELQQKMRTCYEVLVRETTAKDKISAIRGASGDRLGLFLAKVMSTDWRSRQDAVDVNSVKYHHFDDPISNGNFLKSYSRYVKFVEVANLQSERAKCGYIVDSKINDVGPDANISENAIEAMTFGKSPEQVEMIGSMLTRKSSKQKDNLKKSNPELTSLGESATNMENALDIGLGITGAIGGSLALGWLTTGWLDQFGSRYIIKGASVHTVSLSAAAVNLPDWGLEDQVVESYISSLIKNIKEFFDKVRRNVGSLFGKKKFKKESANALVNTLWIQSLEIAKKLGSGGLTAVGLASTSLALAYDRLRLAFGTPLAMALTSVVQATVTFLGGPLVGLASSLLGVVTYQVRIGCMSDEHVRRSRQMNPDFAKGSISHLLATAFGGVSGVYWAPQIGIALAGIGSALASAHSSHLSQRGLATGRITQVSNRSIVASARHLYMTINHFLHGQHSMNPEGVFAALVSLSSDLMSYSGLQCVAVGSAVIALCVGRWLCDKAVKEEWIKFADVKNGTAYTDLRDHILNRDLPKNFDMFVNVVATVANPQSIIPIVVSFLESLYEGKAKSEAINSAMYNYAGVNFVSAIVPLLWRTVSVIQSQLATRTESATRVLGVLNLTVTSIWSLLFLDQLIAKIKEWAQGAWDTRTESAVLGIKKTTSGQLEETANQLINDPNWGSSAKTYLKAIGLRNKDDITESEWDIIEDFVRTCGTDEVKDELNSREKVKTMVRRLVPLKCYVHIALNKMLGAVRWMWNKIVGLFRWLWTKITQVFSNIGKTVARGALGELRSSISSPFLKISEQQTDDAVPVYTSAQETEEGILATMDALDGCRAENPYLCDGIVRNLIEGRAVYLAKVEEINEHESSAVGGADYFRCSSSLPLIAFKHSGDAIGKTLGPFVDVSFASTRAVRIALKKKIVDIDVSVSWDDEFVKIRLVGPMFEVNTVLVEGPGGGTVGSIMVSGAVRDIVTRHLVTLVGVVMPGGALRVEEGDRTTMEETLGRLDSSKLGWLRSYFARVHDTRGLANRAWSGLVGVVAKSKVNRQFLVKQIDYLVHLLGVIADVKIAALDWGDSIQQKLDAHWPKICSYIRLRSNEIEEIRAYVDSLPVVGSVLPAPNMLDSRINPSARMGIPIDALSPYVHWHSGPVYVNNMWDWRMKNHLAPIWHESDSCYTKIQKCVERGFACWRQKNDGNWERAQTVASCGCAVYFFADDIYANFKTCGCHSLEQRPMTDFIGVKNTITKNVNAARNKNREVKSVAKTMAKVEEVSLSSTSDSQGETRRSSGQESGESKDPDRKKKKSGKKKKKNRVFDVATMFDTLDGAAGDVSSCEEMTLFTQESSLPVGGLARLWYVVPLTLVAITMLGYTMYGKARGWISFKKNKGKNKIRRPGTPTYVVPSALVPPDQPSTSSGLINPITGEATRDEFISVDLHAYEKASVSFRNVACRQEQAFLGSFLHMRDGWAAQCIASIVEKVEKLFFG